MRHSETGEIIPARCNSHLCPACSPLHQMTARSAIEKGLVRSLIRTESDTVVFLTLTDTAAGQLDLRTASQKWQGTIKSLRRKWGAGQYAKVTEFQARGAVHPHVFLEVDRQVADDLRDRSSRASYSRRMHELRPMAEGLGWGQMVDAVTIDTLADRERLGQYGAKSIAGYATKEAAEQFKAAGAKRVRPISLSYGWVPGGLAAIRRDLLGSSAMDATRQAGKWERIASVSCGAKSGRTAAPPQKRRRADAA
jgi:hypothetical protein